MHETRYQKHNQNLYNIFATSLNIINFFIQFFDYITKYNRFFIQFFNSNFEHNQIFDIQKLINRFQSFSRFIFINFIFSQLFRH